MSHALNSKEERIVILSYNPLHNILMSFQKGVEFNHDIGYVLQKGLTAHNVTGHSAARRPQPLNRFKREQGEPYIEDQKA